MTIYEYGDRSKPHILLIHGMWMIHEMMLPYVDKLRDDYHIIAPDLTGHGSDTGRFESAQKEASEIVACFWSVARRCDCYGCDFQ